MRQVCFDYQSGTPILPEVFEAMRPFFFEFFGNPSSLHQHGLKARAALTEARERLAQFIHAGSPEEILFTSGGTESINLAIKGAAAASRRGNHIVLSGIEHPAVLNSVAALERQGFSATRVGVDSSGRVDVEAIRQAVTDRTVLLAVQQANQDLGTIQPLEEIGRIAGSAGIPLLVDATTSGGWLPIDVQALGIQLLALAPHRFHGPKGVGVLYRHRRARVAGILHGGDQEGGLRPGTENVPGIVGAGVAAEVAAREMAARIQHVGNLQRELWEGLRRTISHIQLNGPPPGPERISTNLHLSVEGVEGEALLLACDMKGIAFSSGSSCLSKSFQLPPALSGIGLDPELIRSSILLSLGKDNSADEAGYFLETFRGVVDRLRSMSPGWEDLQSGRTESKLRAPGTSRA